MIMEKWTQEQYAARLQEMKQEAHDKMYLLFFQFSQSLQGLSLKLL
jgi:hypothetical protein